jgi:predicted Holliday junction resolvase-like endonuclease
VSAFSVVVLVGLVVVIGLVMMLGRAHQGAPLEQFGLRSAREITETRETLDAEDLQQMLEAHNERRRRRGEPERTVEDVERQVMNERHEQIKRRDALMADRELDQLLEVTNARRRARGLPERTREEVQQEFGRPAAGS